MSFARLKAALKQSLDDVCLPELIRIISEYARDLHHTWYAHDDLDAKKISGNTASSCVTYDGNPWHRVVSPYSIHIGPKRWRIELQSDHIEFGPHWKTCIGIGITSVALGPIRKCGSTWLSMATIEDLIVVNVQSTYIYVMNNHDGETREFSSYDTEATTVVRVQIDTDTRTMELLFEGKNMQQVRTGPAIASLVSRNVLVVIPKHMSLSDCRPCVVIAGSVSAKILPYNSEDDITQT